MALVWVPERLSKQIEREHKTIVTHASKQNKEKMEAERKMEVEIDNQAARFEELRAKKNKTPIEEMEMLRLFYKDWTVPRLPKLR